MRTCSSILLRHRARETVIEMRQQTKVKAEAALTNILYGVGYVSDTRMSTHTTREVKKPMRLNANETRPGTTASSEERA